MSLSKLAASLGMITHRLPLKDIARGFQFVLDGSESIKVIIEANI